MEGLNLYSIRPSSTAVCGFWCDSVGDEREGEEDEEIGQMDGGLQSEYSFFFGSKKKKQKQTRDKCLNNEERKGSDSAAQRSAVQQREPQKRKRGRRKISISLCSSSSLYPIPSSSSFKAARWGDDDDDDVYPIQSTGHTQTWQIALPHSDSAQYTSSPLLNTQLPLYIAAALSVCLFCSVYIHNYVVGIGVVLTSMAHHRTART